MNNGYVATSRFHMNRDVTYFVLNSHLQRSSSPILENKKHAKFNNRLPSSPEQADEISTVREQRLSENSVESSCKMKRSIAQSVSRKHDGGCEEALGL